MTAKKEKKKMGFFGKFFLGLFLTILVISIIIISVLLSTYDNYKIPNQKELKDMQDYKVAEQKLDAFLKSEESTDIVFNFNQKEVNQLLYGYFYKKKAAADFLNETSLDKNYVSKKKNKSVDLGFKGVWIKIKGDVLTITGGADFKKPVKYKSSFHISFKIVFEEGNPEIVLKFKKGYIGKLIVSKGIFVKILPKIRKISSSINKALTKLEEGYPNGDPAARFDFNKFKGYVNIEKMYDFLRKQTSNSYDPDREEDVINMYADLADKTAQKKILNLEVKKSELNLSFKTSSISKNVLFGEDSNKFYSSDRYVDILQYNKEELLLGLNNVYSSDVSDTLYPNKDDFFSLCLDYESLRKVFRYMVETRDQSKLSLFNEGVDISLSETNPRKYNLKAMFPEVYSYKEGVITVRIYFELRIKNQPSASMRSYFEMDGTPSISGDDLLIEISKIKLGDNTELNKTYINGILAYLKEVEFIKNGNFVFKDALKNIKNFLNYEIKEFKASTDQITIIFFMNSGAGVDVKDIKNIVKTVMLELKDKPEYQSIKADAEILLSSSTTISQKAKAHSNILNKNTVASENFIDDLVYMATVLAGESIIEVLNIKTAD